MLRRISALAIGLLCSGCPDLAGDCNNTYSCDPPDAGVMAAQAPPTCEGQCVPGGHDQWSPPFLAWLGDGDPPMCPKLAPDDYYDGVAPPPAPVCGACTCQPSTGSCALPGTVTASTGSCASPGSGTAFDAPSPWDGSCTAYEAITGGVGSATVAPLGMSEDGCLPSQGPATKDLPKSPTSARGCWGNASTGTCTGPGDVCVPAAPAPGPWTYCVSHEGGPKDPYTKACPNGSPYQRRYVFGDFFTDTRGCSPCTCGPPEGSACSSLVTFYADGACSEQIGGVVAQSQSMCVDIHATALGSKQASQPVYKSGACPADGGTPIGDAPLDAPMTLCCLD